MSKRKKKWHECNVVQSDEASAQLWHFNASDRNFALKSAHTETEEQPLPVKAVGKTWQNLIQPKLNIGWLPIEHVYLRTILMPICEPEELIQMLEFQLEKLSPAPVSQIVWSYELIPAQAEGQVTVLLVIVESGVVEATLERFEGSGYHADRLEVPWCHELVTLDRTQDQIWIRVGQVGENAIGLVAWVLNQTVHHVTLLTLPPNDIGAASLCEQLDRTAWTGELEGWLRAIPPITFAGDADECAPLIETLRSWSSHPVQTDSPETLENLATLSARRATRGESQANLMPEEHRTRYRQQYIDGMWMKGVGAMVLFYIFGVLIYFVMLEWMHKESIDLQTRLRTTAVQYTNVLKMQARIDVLQEQVDLKFSALECLRVISEQLPTELTLTSCKFYMGRQLSLFGQVQTVDQEQVVAYHSALINAKVGDQPLFSSVSDPSINASRGRGSAAGLQSRWSFTCELARTGF